MNQIQRIRLNKEQQEELYELARQQGVTSDSLVFTYKTVLVSYLLKLKGFMWFEGPLKVSEKDGVDFLVAVRDAREYAPSLDIKSDYTLERLEELCRDVKKPTWVRGETLH